jgi:hypothetical protein
MKVPDALSRVLAPDTEGNSIGKSLTMNIATLHTKNFIPFWVKNGKTMAEIIDHQQKDPNICPKFGKYWNRQRNVGERTLKEGVLYLTKGERDRLVIPKALELEIIKFYHYPEHPGVASQYRNLKESFVFPGMHAKIENFIKTCEMCVATKRRKTPKLSKVVTPTQRTLGLAW